MYQIPRIAPRAHEYVQQLLDFTFRNAHSPGYTASLEKEFAERFGQTYGIAHANGTATMQSALMASGVGVGDEVIVPTYTVFSTAAAVLHVNAVPIIVDVDPDTWTISIEEIRRHITPRTRAIIPVSIAGLPCDMDPIMAMAKEHNLIVIEDNAQCIIGSYKGRIAGSIGQFASFSFQASKTLTCGDGGMLICRDEHLATEARRAATLGYAALSSKPGDTVVSEEKRCHPSFKRHSHIGWNHRLPEIAAAVAFAELERVDVLADMRKRSGRIFEEVIAECDWLIPQKTPSGYEHAYWTVPARIIRDDIDWNQFRCKFVEHGGDGFYGAYCPLHLETVFANLQNAICEQPQRYPHYVGLLPDYGSGMCPVWERIQPRIIQLKTNYFDEQTLSIQVDALRRTIRMLS